MGPFKFNLKTDADRKSFLYLLLIMVVLTAGTLLTTAVFLYRADFEQQRQQLISTVQSQARMIEAIAQQESDLTGLLLEHIPDYDPIDMVIKQVKNAHTRYEQASRSTEFTLATREADNIVFLLRHRHSSSELPEPIPFASDLAEPQRRALSGESGSIVGLDYRGERVLAAFEPVQGLGIGIVAKMDVAEIRLPFMKAVAQGSAVALVLILFGTIFFFGISSTVLAKLQTQRDDLLKEIDVRKKAEAEINRSKLLLESSIESAPGMIILSLDREYRYLNFNSAHVRSMQMSYQSLPQLGDCIFDHMTSKDDISKLKLFYSRALAGESIVELSEFGVGEGRFYFETQINPILDQDKQVFGLTVFAQDITEKRLAEEALRDREYLLRESQKVANLGSYSLDITSGFWEVSPALLQLFGIDEEYPSNVEGWLRIVHPDDRDEMTEYLKTTVIAEHGAFDKEYRIQRIQDNEVRWVHGRGVLEMDDQDNPFKMIGVIQDITERKQVESDKLAFEKQILHTQKLESLGILAWGIAHDFNNILMGILGYADLALSSLDPISPAKEYVKGINDSSKKAAELVKQMLAYSGKGKFSLEPINLDHLIGDMKQMLNISISKNVVLKITPSSSPVYLEGDPTQIRQVIMNIVINGSDAIQNRSGVISVLTGTMHCDRAYIDATGFNTQIASPGDIHEGMYVFLEISDTGSGMSKAIIERIFEPFYTTKFTGRGLGLSAVLGIIRGHSGFMKIYSEPDKGTTFKVLLPLYSSDTDVMSKSSSPSRFDTDWQGRGIFLIADDEEAVRSVGKAMLKKLGFDVITAEDGREAIQIFEEKQAEIVGVLLDLTMPHKDGAEVFRAIRAINPKVKVILSSGYNEQDATQKFVGKGLAGFIQKPYVTSELLEKIKEVMS